MGDVPATMRAAFLDAPGVLEVRTVPVPRPGAGAVLVRVEAALTCGTDLKTFRRGHARLPVPAPFGHEASGRIAACGDGVTGFADGDAVMWVPTAPCGACGHCIVGRENLCEHAVGWMVLGAYAEYVLLPAHIVARHLFHRPAALRADEAALLEPLACVVHGADRVGELAGRSVAIVGDGAIALLFARVALLRGATRVLLLGRHQQRLAIARAYGAHAVAAPTDDAARAELRAWSADGADVVIECVGTPQTWRLASELAAPGGRVLLFGGCATGTDVSFDAYRVHYEEVDLIGAFHYTPRAVADAHALLCSGAVAGESLITDSRPLDRLADALALIDRRAAVKVAVLP